MDTESFVNYLHSNGWGEYWRTDNYIQMHYLLDYANWIHDEINIWIGDNEISLTVVEQGWGYTNYITKNMTYEEFVQYWETERK